MPRRAMLGMASLVFDEGLGLAAERVRLQVLVAKSAPISDVSVGQLRQIFRGKVLVLGGATAVPFNHPPRTPDRVGFDQLILNMDPQAVARFWIDQKIRSGAEPPRTVDSVGMLLRVIARLPGAIGYVRQGYVAADLKQVRVDGKLPSDSTYPLVYG